MAAASKPTPMPPPRGNARKPARWPERALGVLLDTIAALSEITKWTKSLNAQTERIDRWAALGVDAANEGNYIVAIQLFQDIRNATATQRHTLADIAGAAGKAAAALAAAKVGEYGGE